MEPLSALALACNIIDLVGVAIKCGKAAAEAYNSADGRTRDHELADTKVDELGRLVAKIQDQEEQLVEQEAEENIQACVANILERCTTLRALLDSCRAKKKGTWEAGKAATKFLVNTSKIEALQRGLEEQRRELHLLIATGTRKDIGHILQTLAKIGEKNSDIAKSLKAIDGRLHASLHDDGDLNSSESRRMVEDATNMVRNCLILELLHFSSLNHRYEELRDAHEGTLEWVFTNPSRVLCLQPQLRITFPNWLRKGSGIFHIMGKPGSGKSTLMKFLCHRAETLELLEEWAGDGQEVIFAQFFFWRFGAAQEEKSLKGLVRGLLYQVLRKIPALSKVLFPSVWQEAQDMIKRKQRGQLGTKLIMDAFQRLVGLSSDSTHSSLVNKFRICFFIDGLDEFDENGLNETHGELAQKLLDWTEGSRGNVKMCISSRVQPPFIEMFTDAQRIKLHHLTERDIQIFVRARLETHPKFQELARWEPESCENLIRTLVDAAEGVFLWVALLINSLCRGLEKGDPVDLLRQRVLDTPKELDGFFKTILEDIDPTYRQGSFLLLATLLRTTGTPLATESRLHAHALYDENPPHDHFTTAEGYRGGGTEFYLSLLSCFLILRSIDKRIPMDATFDAGFLNRFENFRGGFSDMETIVHTTVLGRCNGLAEVVRGSFVGFMHRSIPEFLHRYFEDNGGRYGLDDHVVTKTLSWSYLVDIRCFREVELGGVPERAATIGCLLGKDVSPNEPRDDQEYWDAFGPSNNRLFAFLCLLRQVEFAPHWGDVYRILFVIDEVLHDLYDRNHDALLIALSKAAVRRGGPEGWDGRNRRYYRDSDYESDSDSDGTGRRSGLRYRAIPTYDKYFRTCYDVRGQYWSLVSLGAFIGLYEFIDWVFLQTNLFRTGRGRDADGHFQLYMVVRSSIAAFESDPTEFAVQTLRVLLDYDGDRILHINFPPASPNAGIPLWHAFLLHACQFSTNEPSARALDLWLRQGANPRVAYECRHGGIKFVFDRRDRSGRLRCADIAGKIAAKIPLDMAYLGGTFSLRFLVEVSQAANKQTLLALIGEEPWEDRVLNAADCPLRGARAVPRPNYNPDTRSRNPDVYVAEHDVRRIQFSIELEEPSSEHEAHYFGESNWGKPNHKFSNLIDEVSWENRVRYKMDGLLGRDRIVGRVLGADVVVDSNCRVGGAHEPWRRRFKEVGEVDIEVRYPLLSPAGTDRLGIVMIEELEDGPYEGPDLGQPDQTTINPEIRAEKPEASIRLSATAEPDNFLWPYLYPILLGFFGLVLARLMLFEDLI